MSTVKNPLAKIQNNVVFDDIISSLNLNYKSILMNSLLIITTVTSCLRLSSFSAATTVPMALRSVDFEVFGRVQGVFFRKYTKDQAEKLALKGWCRNTSKGTVEGQMQGPSDKVETMMNWLKTTGSPSSQIDKANFKNDKEISEYTFSNFDIRRDN
ncbi:acylphosphatase-2 [Bicyclus anynana]|uniref:Acylphosphatase n=1 Tax=Bicyclus anynana TaxID=110368 RepID=A0A6J1N9P0_BICAN|nr:acylphosphatase-2 [Bicyclus anynana]XP_052740888.1 acylphosphatase-2 [Bicyclus anynana]XP_052740889.1 acylphosphatase-2 [Bicyclus anynana]